MVAVGHLGYAPIYCLHSATIEDVVNLKIHAMGIKSVGKATTTILESIAKVITSQCAIAVGRWCLIKITTHYNIGWAIIDKGAYDVSFLGMTNKCATKLVIERMLYALQVVALVTVYLTTS